MFKQEVSRHLQDLRDFVDAEWFIDKSFPPSRYSVRLLCPGNNIECDFELNVSRPLWSCYDPSMTCPSCPKFRYPSNARATANKHCNSQSWNQWEHRPEYHHDELQPSGPQGLRFKIWTRGKVAPLPKFCDGRWTYLSNSSSNPHVLAKLSPARIPIPSYFEYRSWYGTK